ERLRLEQCQRLLAVDRGGDVEVALPGQTPRQRESIVIDVVDHEQRGVGVGHDGCPAGTKTARAFEEDRSWPGLSRPSRFTWHARARSIGIAGTSPAMTPNLVRSRHRSSVMATAP